MRQQQKNSDKKMYASMARMSNNVECPCGNFGDCSQLKFCIFDSGETCHMASKVLYFIMGSLEDTDNHIEVVDRHNVTAKKSSSTNKNVQ